MGLGLHVPVSCVAVRERWDRGAGTRYSKMTVTVCPVFMFVTPCSVISKGSNEDGGGGGSGLDVGLDLHVRDSCVSVKRALVRPGGAYAPFDQEAGLLTRR